MRKSILATSALLLLVFGAFQNCGKLGFSTDNASSLVSGLGFSSSSVEGASGSLDDDGPPVTSGGGTDDSPALAVNSHPRHPREGQSTVVTAFPQNLEGLSYSCSPTADPSRVVASGDLGQEIMMFKLDVTRDVVCTFTGRGANVVEPIRVPFEIDVQCGAKIKSTDGACSDVVCNSSPELAADARGQWNDVPARTDDGVCYYRKILGAIAAGPVDSSAPRDEDVLARDPGGADPAGRAPRVTASFAGSFRLRGPRTVRLSSAPDGAKPLTVADLLIVESHPQDAAPDLSADVRAFGSAAANLVFRGTPLALRSTTVDAPLLVPAVDVTSFAEVRRRQTLDVRAESTGGDRAVSEVFVLFQ